MIKEILDLIANETPEEFKMWIESSNLGESFCENCDKWCNCDPPLELDEICDKFDNDDLLEELIKSMGIDKIEETIVEHKKRTTVEE